MALTKQELIAAIAEQAGYSKADVKSIIDAQEVVVQNALAEDGELTLPGIGKLHTQVRAARTGRNPRTGEPVAIPAKTTVKFGAAKALKDAVA